MPFTISDKSKFGDRYSSRPSKGQSYFEEKTAFKIVWFSDLISPCKDVVLYCTGTDICQYEANGKQVCQLSFILPDEFKPTNYDF